MSKVLRNILKQVIPKFTLKKYFIYALGEITLLVVGILIALQINNWNENKKNDNQLSQIFKTIESDLTQDTIAINQMIYFYEIQDTLCDKFINKEITEEYFEKCLYCRGLGTIYLPFHSNKKGYQLLENFTVSSESQDSLAENIVKFYNQFSNLFTASNEMLQKNILRNIDSFQKKDWYVDWTQNKNAKKITDYYCNSEDFRKKIATYKLYAISNHLQILKQYKKSITFGLKQIKNRD